MRLLDTAWAQVGVLVMRLLDMALAWVWVEEEVWVWVWVEEEAWVVDEAGGKKRATKRGKTIVKTAKARGT